jgi:L1 cell adhesion molecule
MDPAKLKALESVQIIDGFLMIQGQHPNFTSLSFFKNLEKIHGREVDS